MASFIDSHCHLDMLDITSFPQGLTDVVQQALDNHVTHMLCVSVDDKKHDVLQKIAETFQNVYFSVGLHPNDSPERVIVAEDLIQLADHPKLIAIGETGLDYYRTVGDVAWQKERFEQHIRAAQTVNKPLIIHTRQARKDTIDILSQYPIHDIGAVLHCFTEDWETAKAALDLGLYISFSGIVTFKNATEIQEVAKKVPLDRMLIETDSPYLAPIPFRGKPNYPAYVRHVAEFIATLREEPLEAIATQTTQNFFDLFKLTAS
jgi:TatD DNase family protein